MARKGTTDPRKIFNVKLSSAERTALQAKAAAADMTMAELIRNAVSSALIVNRNDALRQNFLLTAIGTNLNQLARYANTFRDDAEMLILTEYLRQIDYQICTAFDLPPASLYDRRPRS